MSSPIAPSLLLFARHHVFVVGIACQQFENAFENTALRPSAEALVHDLPVAEAGRQITPWNPRSISGENRIDRQPVSTAVPLT